MADDERVSLLEERLRKVEDQLEIMRLLSSYGPSVDSGSSREAAELWTDDGAYDVGGMHRAEGHDRIADLYDSDHHQWLIHQGSAHLTEMPRVTVDGDRAEAVGYSAVLLREGDRWMVWRASANHWTLQRTEAGWRVETRYNRVLDGSDESHRVLRRGVDH
jgi:SnoaL-like domain